METKPNRAWVKDAAIVFLVILLVLTFFSNTIMNHSLPEVATQMVSNGTITAKVRGTGTVTAVGTHKVKATESITIGRVLVKSGQEVNAGDVLFVLGAADSSKLEEAYATLEDLQASYAQQAASSPILSQFVDEQNEVKRKRDTVTEKKRTVDELALELFNTNSEGAVSAAQEILDMFTRRDELLAQINSYKNDLYIVQSISGYATKISEIQTQIDDEKAKAEPNQETIDMLEAEITRLTTEQASAQATVDAMTYSNETAINGEITRLQTEYDSISAKLDTSGITLEKAKKFISTYQEYGYAVDDVAAAQEALNNKLASQNQSVAASSASLTAISNKIKRQQEKIKKLSGEGDSNTITANVSGTVTEVNCTAGDSMIKDDILCAIEVPDQGYTVSFSVTNDQAKRLHVGDTATISNYYWGNEIVATLSSIQTDKKKPMTNKTLTFNLEGDVTSGSELTISVGQKSANYDTIIPNSAIRSDSNGSFVLAVTAKNSPLGNRYIAKRVKIEVLAQDDNNAAVTADLSNGDYVITTSSAPISSGDMVRLADSEK
jgi:biotin carboxyl carrier protein